jgi:tetratricopeptide (TPR) repeat protein
VITTIWSLPLGATYLSTGEIKNALPYFLEALEIRKFSQPPQNIPDTAMLWNNLGLVYMDDNHEAALQAFQEALALFRKAGYPDLAILRKNIGVLHKLLGDVPKAFQFFQESLAAKKTLRRAATSPPSWSSRPSSGTSTASRRHSERRKIFNGNPGAPPVGASPDAPRIAAILSSIATLYQSQGEHAPAMPILRESLEIFQKAAPGVVHPATFAEIFNNLGVGSQILGDLEALVQYFQEALEYSSMSRSSPEPSTILPSSTEGWARVKRVCPTSSRSSKFTGRPETLTTPQSPEPSLISEICTGS